MFTKVKEFVKKEQEAGKRKYAAIVYNRKTAREINYEKLNN